jgi:hypothetical protein
MVTLAGERASTLVTTCLGKFKLNCPDQNLKRRSAGLF